MQTYELKRGDLLSLGGFVDLPAGAWVATAQARNIAHGLVANLAVTLNAPVPPSTRHAILIEGDTAAWPIADVVVDVRFADSGAPAVVLHTETFTVRVAREVTGA